MKTAINYVTCETCGKQHKANSKKVIWNEDKLEYNCVKCNLVSVVFTKSELERMLGQTHEYNSSILVFGGHVEDNQFYKARKPLI